MDQVRNVLSRCYRCKEYNPVRIDGFRHIEAYELGEKVSFDIIRPLEGRYIITAIDYFSRFTLAKVFKSKNTNNVLKFLEIVHKKLNVKKFISDGALENISDTIRKWMDINYIKQHITSGYHHCSNGRIERFNRTVGEGLKKQDKTIRFTRRLENVIKTYNQTTHSAIGITPEEAFDIENLSEMKRKHFENRVERYKKLFNNNNKTRLKLHLKNKVLIEDSVHRFK